MFIQETAYGDSETRRRRSRRFTRMTVAFDRRNTERRSVPGLRGLFGDIFASDWDPGASEPAVAADAR